MYYYIKEVNEFEDLKNTAGIKARDDVECILEKCGYKSIFIKSLNEERKSASKFMKLLWHFRVKKMWCKSADELKDGDVLLVQIPVIEHSLFLESAFKKIKKKGVNIIFVVHDLESLRFSNRKGIGIFMRLRVKIEDNILLDADNIIAHNKKMANILRKKTKNNCNIVSLGLFDYLSNDIKHENKERHALNKPVVIAGTLRKHKAKYVYSLPNDLKYNLYGVGYEGKNDENIKYYGAFPPEELPNIIEGSFGLVWDGDSTDTCSGIYGRYLKINNPHKVSLYMASGIPVIIWKEAALADFILKNNCGFVIETLNDISKKIDSLSDDEYKEMLFNVNKIKTMVNEGYYLKNAISKCV